METDPNNYVKIDLKKSSSSGKMGYDISVGTDGSVPQEQLQKIAENALNVALKTEAALHKLGK